MPLPQRTRPFLGNAHVEECNASAWLHDSPEFGEERRKIEQVAQREPAHHAVDRCTGDREAKNVGLDARASRSVGRQHAEAQVHRDWAHSSLCKINAQIAGAACQIEHRASAGKRQSRTARLRQRTSSRKEMMRLRRSYFGAIASNMSRTAATFSSPSGSCSVSQDRAVAHTTEARAGL